jgi:lysozyme
MAKRVTKKIQTTKQPIKPVSKKIRMWLWFGLFCTVILFSWYVVRTLKLQKEEEQAESAVYDAFGTDIPIRYPIHGIDVSSHQNSISWRKVSAMNVKKVKMNFAFMKATEGLGNTDEYYKRNYTNAKKAGMICGAYHFFLATKSGVIQANNFIKNTALAKGDLPPVVDIEQLYGVAPFTMRNRLKEFLTTVESAYKIKPIIYSYVDFYEHFLGKEFDEYPLWVAHYEEKDKPRIGRDWIFWQHSEDGHVNGISTPVDLNVFRGDSLAFQELLIK